MLSRKYVSFRGVPKDRLKAYVSEKGVGGSITKLCCLESFLFPEYVPGAAGAKVYDKTTLGKERGQKQKW